MKFLMDAVGRLPAIQYLFDTVTGEGASPVAAFGLPEAARSVLICSLLRGAGRPMIVVTATESEARRMCGDARSLGVEAEVFPGRDFSFVNTLGASKEYQHQRITALWRFLKGQTPLLFLDIEAFTARTLSKKSLLESAVELKVGDEVELNALAEALVEMGYCSTTQVEGVGQFAVRGGIMDIFTPGSDRPVRLELWGDEIDSMAYFDTEDQRRLDNCEALTLLPAVEFFGGREELAKLLEGLVLKFGKKHPALADTIARDTDTLKAGGELCTDRYMEYLGAEYLADNIGEAVLVFSECRNIFSRLSTLKEGRLSLTEELVTKGIPPFKWELFCDKADVSAFIKKSPTLYLDSFTGVSYPVPPAAVGTALVKQLSCWGGGMDILIEDLQPALKRNMTVAILQGSQRGAELLVAQLEENKIKATLVGPDQPLSGSGVYVLPCSLSQGLELIDEALLVISHRPTPKVAKKFKSRSKAESFNSLDELKVGDYVVHYAHGIGQFDGIHRIETGNVVKDYIKIKYKGTDVLYLPVTQLELVSRYIGAAGENGPMLHRLGSKDFERAKSRVRAAVKDIAKELIRLYGERMQLPGHAFMPDSELQADFEARFPYEETEDQLRASEDIKRDMERPVPMDRLLCGDVGFGKTEVALRAAFKCICEGKQCAILVPTTILAWQHYLTATERFGDLPVTTEMLSRFRTKRQIEKTVAAIKKGDVDLVIGTHRMISEDVKFRDLGLVIIDEEQRFGVAQKEKLKTKFKSVDVLTLTATPIPRTLNMALSGIRDMSSIEEAPSHRQPVQTYVLEQNNALLLEAISKELQRGGQVYYLHNRVESIAKCAARLKALLPDASIGMAHGKMSEEELSSVWRALLEGEIDILVCTTIIETGVDVPNCNTLIIEDADRMGLAQLHQIRGRVGRSTRRAYAYFCFRRGKALSEVATKRLEAIREYTEFGSGFKIAMRDLEIRGAGNVLGGEQHGHMDAVGYDMYIKLLNEAIGLEKGEVTERQVQCTVDLDISANIPEEYIPSLSHRLSIYRRIADITSREDKMDVIDELVDRFGDPPKEVMGLMDIALLKGAAAANGIYEISGNRTQIDFFVADFNPTRAGEIAKKLGQGALLVPTDPVRFTIKLSPGQDASALLRDIANRL